MEEEERKNSENGRKRWIRLDRGRNTDAELLELQKEELDCKEERSARNRQENCNKRSLKRSIRKLKNADKQ